MAKQEKQKRVSGVKSTVFRYLYQKPGVVVFLDDITRDTGLNRIQVQAAVYNLVNNDGHPIRVLARGREWMYKPEPELVRQPLPEPEPEKQPTITMDTGELFVKIGTLKDGGIVLKDETHRLYRAEEM